MPQPSVLKTYDLATNIITVGGQTMSGFGEDGGVEYEFSGDRFEHTSGADGEVVVSKTNEPRVIATITVMETSRGYNILSELHKSQEDQIPIAPLPYLHTDPLNGDLVRSAYAVFLNYPTPNKARAAGEREFQILLPFAARSFKPAGQG